MIWLVAWKKKQSHEKQSGHRVTVKGTAVTLNGEAAVQTDRAVIYYVRGMQAWEKIWIGQKVLVIGDLETDTTGNKQVIGSAVMQLLAE